MRITERFDQYDLWDLNNALLDQFFFFFFYCWFRSPQERDEEKQYSKEPTDVKSDGSQPPHRNIRGVQKPERQSCSYRAKRKT